MTINSKQKGARFERTLSGMFRDYGYDTHRTAQYCGKTGDAADVDGLPYIHIEAKHQERMMLYDWMAQATRDAEKSGKMPTVFHKRNNSDVLVTMWFDDWMKLYQEYEASMSLADQYKEKEDGRVPED